MNSMLYVVVELQTYENGTVGTLVNNYDNREMAESKYHQILTSAAVSSIPCHSAVMMTNEGIILKSERYLHEGGNE